MSIFVRSLVVLALMLPTLAGATEKDPSSTFVLEENWVTRLSVDEQNRLVTMERDDEDDIDGFPTYEPPRRDGELPANFSWKNQGGDDWMMPVRDQQRCGSCAAFGITGMLEALVKIELGAPDLDIDLSDSHCLTCSGGDCTNGISLADGISTLIEEGLPTEECSPYNEFLDGSIDLTQCGEVCPGGEKGRVWLTGIERVRVAELPLEQQVETIKQALVHAPVLISIGVWNDLFGYGGGVYVAEDESDETRRGMHALLLVGWDDDKQAWLARNSWGGSWGLGGYLWLGWGTSWSHDSVWSPVSSEYHALFDIDHDGFASVDVGGTDCDDFDTAVGPGAPEIRGDGIDQNCDGVDADLASTDGDGGFACSTASAGASLLALALLPLGIRRRR